ncbi:MAG: hypothetical protein AB7F99_14115 [Vicinamibacterales bacterium]
MPFTLPNSGIGTETDYANAHVTCNLETGTQVGAAFLSLDSNGCWVADKDYLVILVKAGGGQEQDSDYAMYVNVQQNDVICSPNSQGISHITWFCCVCEEELTQQSFELLP